MGPLNPATILPTGNARAGRTDRPKTMDTDMAKSKPTRVRNEQTSKQVASKAGKILKNPKSSKAAKSVAASALTQAPDKKAKKK